MESDTDTLKTELGRFVEFDWSVIWYLHHLEVSGVMPETRKLGQQSPGGFVLMLPCAYHITPVLLTV